MMRTTFDVILRTMLRGNIDTEFGGALRHLRTQRRTLSALVSLACAYPICFQHLGDR